MEYRSEIVYIYESQLELSGTLGKNHNFQCVLVL